MLTQDFCSFISTLVSHFSNIWYGTCLVRKFTPLLFLLLLMKISTRFRLDLLISSLVLRIRGKTERRSNIFNNKLYCERNTIERVKKHVFLSRPVCPRICGSQNPNTYLFFCCNFSEKYGLYLHFSDKFPFFHWINTIFHENLAWIGDVLKTKIV